MRCLLGWNVQRLKYRTIVLFESANFDGGPILWCFLLDILKVFTTNLFYSGTSVFQKIYEYIAVAVEQESDSTAFTHCGKN